MSTFGHSEPDLCGCGQKIGHRERCLFRRTPPPDGGLPEPVRDFDETFSAQDLVLELLTQKREQGHEDSR